jgi:hypothetical protein
MQNLKRSKSMNFRVTPKEYEMIMRRKAQTGIVSTRAYLLKQAIDGRVIHVELDSVKECTRTLSNISSNINQIAKRVNATGNGYVTDLEDIKTRQEEIWQAHRDVLHKLNKILDAVK